MKNSNKRGFSLVIAMGLIIVMTVMAMVVLEFAIPFSKDIKGVENASNAYYQANSGFEEAIYFISKNIVGSEISKTISLSSNIDYGYQITASGKFSPTPGRGNSDFDKDWNKIFQGNPIQMEIGYNKIQDFGNSKAYFRVPNLDGNGGLSFSGGSYYQVINWKLTSENNSIDASGSLLNGNEVCDSSGTTIHNTCYSNFIFNDSLNGNKLDGTSSDFKEFYDDNCSNTNSGCTLKLTVINNLETTNNIKIPYLEWKIVFGSSTVPTRYADIEVSGKSNGFKKSIIFSIPQKTGIDSFDFTVFQ